MWTGARLVPFFLLAIVTLTFQASGPAPNANNIQTSKIDSQPVPKHPTPTVFQADEGDRWMLVGIKSLIFKVDPVTTGSDALMVGTEEMPPGNIIPTHKHLYENEVIFVHKGAVR
jgi:quercetin dioxygenase-like cupin family protein